MTSRQLLLRWTELLRQAGIPDPETDAALLLSSLCGRAPLVLRLDTDTDLSPDLQRSFESLAVRRLKREPLQYILGESPFFGRMFRVSSAVLIPRPETELLCEWALDVLRNVPSPAVLDLCTGSGCIGLTLKAERPDASVTLSDISPDALSVARENAALFSLDVSFGLSDLFASLSGSFDLIVSNPPYIPSGTCPSLQPEVLREPLLALDGGTDGLVLYRRLIGDSSCFLKPGGWLLLEIGAGQANAVADLLRTGGFSSVAVRPDYRGIPRMILAKHALEESCLKS